MVYRCRGPMLGEARVALWHVAIDIGQRVTDIVTDVV